MSDQHHHQSSSTKGLAFACLSLSLALLLVFPAFAWYGYGRHGMAGFWAAVVALAVCWLGAFSALLLVGVSRQSSFAVQATLLATLLRMGLPLIVGLALHQLGGELARAGVFGMILCYYFVALVVETPLSVRLVGGKQQLVAKA